MIWITKKFETWQVDSFLPVLRNIEIFNPKIMKWRHNDVIIVFFFKSLYKTWPRQSTELKLCRLIAFGKFHKISKFENHVTRNDVIMMSLPKTMKKCGRPRNQSNYISFERPWRELSKNASFIKFEQKLWAFKWNFGVFTTSTHQIWLNHVTPGANFENL